MAGDKRTQGEEAQQNPDREAAASNREEGVWEEKLGENLEKLAQLEARVREEQDKFLRLFAEFENYKKRIHKERIDLYKSVGQEVIAALLPVLDDFQRANKEIARSGDDKLLEGVELIYNKLKEVLQTKGLEPMVVGIGDPFDTDFHEAITQIPAPDKKLRGKVIEVVQMGYLLNDKVIRFAKVVVGR